MSVLIKGMEMPENCGECRFAYQDQDGEHNVDWVCSVTHKILFPHDCRDDCPLVEIPPHGRLIDTDVVIDRIDMNIELYGADFPITQAMMRNVIERAPTFMDAEE